MSVRRERETRGAAPDECGREDESPFPQYAPPAQMRRSAGSSAMCLQKKNCEMKNEGRGKKVNNDDDGCAGGDPFGAER